MKSIYLLFIATLILFLNSCIEKFNDINLRDIEKVFIEEQDADVIFNGDYLQFKSLVVYDSICRVLSEMEYEEFKKWEDDFGFKSAKTWKEEFLNELANVKSKEQKAYIIDRYADKFDYDEENQIVKYHFFANSMDCILNIDGYVEIENSLYKFTEDNQYISYDGSKSRIENAILKCNLKSLENNIDPYLWILYEGNLKSSNACVEEGVKTVGDYRLVYSFNKIIFSTFKAFDPYTGIGWYQWGYGLNITMGQFYDGWFGWRSEKAYYYLRDINIVWHELGIEGPSFNGPMPDKNYTDRKRKEVTHYSINVGYVDTYMGYSNFYYNLDVTFWSSGIGNQNKITLNIDNKD